MPTPLRSSTRPPCSATRRGAPDEGFTLIEVMVAIAIVTVVMAALTSLFAGTIKTTNHFRMQQSAIMLTTTALDHARSIGAVDAVLGRTSSGVDTQFAAFANTPVAPWLTSMDPLYDDSAYIPDLPTTPVEQVSGSATYQINYFVGSCHRVFSYSSVSEDCSNGPRDDRSEYIEYTRVVVAVTWQDATCDASTCYHVSAVLLNGDEDPLFNMNYGDPPRPRLTNCRDHEVFLGQDVRIMLFGKTQPHEDPPLCDLDGGVPPFSWEPSALPDGLAIGVDPETQITYIQGTVSGDAGEVPTVLTVTDAYAHSDSSNEFTWMITDPEPTIDDIGDQRSRLGAPFTLAVDSTCPLGPCTFTLGEAASIDQEQPPADDDESDTGDSGDDETDTGDDDPEPQDPPVPPPPPVSPVQIDPDTGTLSGLAPELNTVVHGLTVTITAANGKHATTAPFDWTFTDGPILPAIADQVSYVGEPVNLDTAGDCGDHGPCAYSGDLPNWMALSGAGVLSGTPTGSGEFDVTITLTDSQDPAESDSTTFTWTIYDETRILPIPDQEWMLGIAIEDYQVAALCGRSPCTLASSGLPDNISMSADGKISGEPSTKGSGIATVTLTDAGGKTATASFEWSIFDAPTIGAIGSQTWKNGKRIADIQAMLSCDRTPCTVTGKDLPIGVSVSPDGKLTGKPTGYGSGTATITVTDRGGMTASTPLVWAVPNPPSINPLADQTKWKKNKTISTITVGKACYWEGKCTVTGTGLPTGVSVSSDGKITGKPTKSGNGTARITVTDDGEQTAEATFTWTVKSK